ncbi:hypothetical protein EVAR_8866_1 [Eumeta japonica]|uniref:Uncharacterized protein n=1 Tax=Eumeta variegata TaxID=151549 RepID=A0A4C1U1K2_EUMVA|nr:hypothetical protein EVAR_8866_1 [Eumeta japonica]
MSSAYLATKKTMYWCSILRIPGHSALSSRPSMQIKTKPPTYVFLEKQLYDYFAARTVLKIQYSLRRLTGMGVETLVISGQCTRDARECIFDAGATLFPASYSLRVEASYNQPMNRNPYRNGTDSVSRLKADRYRAFVRGSAHVDIKRIPSSCIPPHHEIKIPNATPFSILFSVPLPISIPFILNSQHDPAFDSDSNLDSDSVLDPGLDLNLDLIIAHSDSGYALDTNFNPTFDFALDLILHFVLGLYSKPIPRPACNFDFSTGHDSDLDTNVSNY